MAGTWSWVEVDILAVVLYTQSELLGKETSCDKNYISKMSLPNFPRTDWTTCTRRVRLRLRLKTVRRESRDRRVSRESPAPIECDGKLWRSILRKIPD